MSRTTRSRSILGELTGGRQRGHHQISDVRWDREQRLHLLRDLVAWRPVCGEECLRGSREELGVPHGVCEGVGHHVHQVRRCLRWKGVVPTDATDQHQETCERLLVATMGSRHDQIDLFKACGPFHSGLQHHDVVGRRSEGAVERRQHRDTRQPPRLRRSRV